MLCHIISYLYTSPLGMRAVADQLEIRPLPACYPTEFVRSRSNTTSVIWRSASKFWPLVSCRSRSQKVIGTDTDLSATYDFLLTFHNNHGPISCRFREERRFQSKIAKLYHAHVNFTLRLRRSLWNGVTQDGLKKLENDGANWLRKCLIISLAATIKYT